MSNSFYFFTTFDDDFGAILRLAPKPKSITVEDKSLKQSKTIETNNWTWTSLDQGGILKINYSSGKRVEIIK